MSKRKLKEENFSKRQRLSKEENLRCDSDDEQLMCAAADEIERQIHDDWGDSDEEQLMCDAADEIERQINDGWSDSDEDQLVCEAVNDWERANQRGEGINDPAQPSSQIQPAQPQHQPRQPSQPPIQQPQPPIPQPQPQLPQPQPQVPQPQPQVPQAALNNTVTSSTFIPANNQDLLAVFRELEVQIQEALRQRLTRNHSIRAYITVDASYSRESLEATQHIIQHFRSRALILNSEADIFEHLSDMMREIYARSQDFEAQGSGWNLVEIINLQLHIVTYEPLSGSSYIPSPTAVKNTKGVLNIQNKDNRCIIWCILAQFHPIKPKKTIQSGSKSTNNIYMR